jgi:hypothetical protein
VTLAARTSAFTSGECARACAVIDPLNSSPIWAVAFVIVAHASLSSATSFGSSKMPQGTCGGKGGGGERDGRGGVGGGGEGAVSRAAAARVAADLAVAAAQAEHKVERRLLLDVVVGERAAILELLAREDQPLLVGRDALLVLDLRLHIVDRVGGLDLERDGLAGEGLDEDLKRRATAAYTRALCR